MAPPPTGQPRSTWNVWPTVQVHPGTGVVDRHDDILLVVPVLTRGSAEPVRELVALCSRPDPGGRARVEALRALVARQAAAELPGFALLIRTAATLRAVVHGAVELLVDGAAPSGSGAGDGSRLTQHVLEDLAWREVTVTPTRDAAVDPAEIAAGLPLDLRSGTVPGGGVTLLPVATVAAQPSTGSPTSLTALRPVVQFRTVLLGECAVRAPGGQPERPPRRAPLPVAGQGGGAVGAGTTGTEVLVDGVLCVQGHFTDADRPTCLSCGTPLPADAHRVRLPRPPTGILVTDGGTIYTVTGDLVIGREPETAPDVVAGRAHPLPLRDSARSTSRVHAHLTVSGWRVLLSDDASANGTFLSRHGAAGPWLPVPPHSPVPLVHGDRIRLGKRQLLFDAWRETVVPQVFR